MRIALVSPKWNRLVNSYPPLGIGYLAIALARLVSILLDKSYDKSNWISLAIEIVLGIILVI